ncbi:MAG TPA: hypothetical protein VEB43_10175 [Anaeromyxobacter sp.]|nr:hypothetical protein [Anaeromyxobacter sp.]
MLRAAAWSVGLFGIGMLVCRLFPASWLEAPVLLALGVAMLWVSARTPKPRRARLVQPKEAAA